MKNAFLTSAVPFQDIYQMLADIEGLGVSTPAGDGEIDNFGRFNEADKSSLTYYDGTKKPPIVHSMACVIASPDMVGEFDADYAITSDNPRRTFILLAQAIMVIRTLDYDRIHADLLPTGHGKESRIHPSAILFDGCKIGENCDIGPGAIVHPNVVIGNNVRIKSASIVGDSGAAIHVTGNEVLSQPHFGGLIIEDNVEIGSQCNLVRGIFGATVIGKNSIVGNQVNIGHNVHIGENSWVGVGATIGGFTTIGSFTNVGMAVVCRNGVAIGDDCNIAMATCIMKPVPDGKSCFGNPAKIAPIQLRAGPVSRGGRHIK